MKTHMKTNGIVDRQQRIDKKCKSFGEEKHSDQEGDA